jgi:hypothetical protein
MRALLVVVFCGGATAAAQERFVERTPLPHRPPVHSMARAGNPVGVSCLAVPSVTARDVGGYVGGAKLLGNHIFAKGAGVATGPLADGTFGTDYAGLTVRPNRVFLAPSYDPSVGPTVARSYRTDGPHVPDVLALRPFRKAILEKKEDAEHRHTGRE